MKITRVGDGLTGNTKTSCAACGEPGHMYTVEGLPDGYIDACDEHAEDIAADAVADHIRAHGTAAVASAADRPRCDAERPYARSPEVYECSREPNHKGDHHWRPVSP